MPFCCPFLSFRSFFTLAQGNFRDFPCAIAAKTIESFEECARRPAIFNSRMYYIRAPRRQANFSGCEAVYRVRCGLFPNKGLQTFCLALPCPLRRHRWHEAGRRFPPGLALRSTFVNPTTTSPALLQMDNRSKADRLKSCSTCNGRSSARRNRFPECPLEGPALYSLRDDLFLCCHPYAAAREISLDVRNHGILRR